MNVNSKFYILLVNNNEIKPTKSKLDKIVYIIN